MRLLAVLLSVTVLVAGLPLSVTASYNVEDEPLLRYGRVALAEEPNADSLLFAYDQIVAGVAVAATEINLYDRKVSIDELSMAMEAIRSDYPEFFWMGSRSSYSDSGSYVRTVYFQYTKTGQALETKQCKKLSLNG